MQEANGYWATMGCSKAAQLPLACRKANDDTKWQLSPAGSKACAAGWLARPPSNGYANAQLRVAAGEGAAAGALLNVSVDGRAASPLLTWSAGISVRVDMMERA